MTITLNGPVELGMRALLILAEGLPLGFDLSQLVLLDYCLLHSEDVGGPESIYPPLPIRAGGLGTKREMLERGLELLVRTDLAHLIVLPDGIKFIADDSAPGFISILQSELAIELQRRAKWVVGRFGGLSEELLRDQMRTVTATWSEQFSLLQNLTDDGAE